MRIELHRRFVKEANKLSPAVQDQLRERLRLFRIEPVNPTLRLHRLKGKYAGYSSINITGDIRAIFRALAEDHFEFTRIGTHSQLY